MELKFRDDAGKIKGLPKFLKEVTKTRKIKSKPWEILKETEKTKKLIDLEIDEKTQSAVFILNEKSCTDSYGRKNTVYNRIIGAYYRGCQKNIEPITYQNNDWGKPEKKYFKISKMKTNKISDESFIPSKFQIDIAVVSQSQKLSGRIIFN